MVGLENLKKSTVMTIITIYLDN